MITELKTQISLEQTNTYKPKFVELKQLIVKASNRNLETGLSRKEFAANFGIMLPIIKDWVALKTIMRSISQMRHLGSIVMIRDLVFWFTIMLRR